MYEIEVELTKDFIIDIYWNKYRIFWTVDFCFNKI